MNKTMRVPHISKNLSSLSIAIVVLMLGPVNAASAQHQLFASPDGKGKQCEAHNPCSLPSAQAKARTLAPDMQEDLTITLAPGIYRLQQTLLLQSEDSGNNGHVIRWQGSPDGKTILDGATRVRGWKLVDKQKNLWRAAVPPGSNAQQLYINGVRAVSARHKGCTSPAQCRYNATGLTGGAEALGTLAHPDRVIAVFGVRWRDFHCRIQSFQGDNIVMAEPCWHNTIVDSVKNGWSNASPKGKPFRGIDWFENAYEFLGEPGQFYIDPQANTLYYVPRPGEHLDTADIELPVTEHLLTIQASPKLRAHDIEFRNLTFAHSSWPYSETDGYVPLQAGYMVTGPRQTLPDNGEGMVRIPAAVEVFGGANINFVSDKFEALGAAGIALDRGTRDSTIASSSFRDLAGGAIFVGDTVAAPVDAADRAAGNRVTRNTISHIALDYRDNVGIMGGFNDGLTIDHNSISDVPYTGISVGWGWNYEGEGDVQRNIRIHANRISDFMLTLHDGGAIYTQAQSPGSSVTENSINYDGHDNGNGIYLDERSRKYEVCGNVVWNEPAKMKEGQWVSAWSSWSGDLNIHDNWSDDPHTALHNPGPTKRFHDNHLGLHELPPEAQAVIEASGAEGHGEPANACAQ